MKLITWITTVCISYGMAPSAPLQVNSPFLDWSITAEKAGLVRARATICLKNLTRGRHIEYNPDRLTQSVGVNLSWLSAYEDTPYVIEEARSLLEPMLPRSTVTPGKAIQFGQLLAIKVGTAGYLGIENRTFGIDLGFSQNPVYDWYLVGVGRPGDGILPNTKVGILHRSGRFLVHQNRRIGFELGWWRYFPPLPPQAVTSVNPALQVYKSNDDQIRPLLKRLDRINPPLAALLRKVVKIK